MTEDSATMYSEDVTDSADTSTLAEEGNILSADPDIVARVHFCFGYD